MKKLLIVLIIFALLGVYFTGVIAEEIYHSATMKGATAICIPTNLKINDSLQNGFLWAYTVIDFDQYEDVEEYNSIRETSEKIASIMFDIFTLLLAMILGAMIWEVKL